MKEKYRKIDCIFRWVVFVDMSNRPFVRREKNDG
jgi:hypothetical protein